MKFIRTELTHIWVFKFCQELWFIFVHFPDFN
jgi:hypothetical protein